MEYTFLVNGFEVTAQYDDAIVETVFRPLLLKLSAMQREKGGRLIAFLAAPPAVGKSTLAAFLEYLSRQDENFIPVQALGMDGFHYHQDYILSHTAIRDGREVPMKSVKGAPESFDIHKLMDTLRRVRSEDLRWPYYDRRLHDVVEDAVPVSEKILIIEGNWLLLDEPLWKDLECDYSIFIGGSEDALRERLIQRKIRGGLSRSEAEAFYDACDGPNILRCMACSREADLRLELTPEGLRLRGYA